MAVAKIGDASLLSLLRASVALAKQKRPGMALCRGCDEFYDSEIYGPYCPRCA